MNIYSLVSDDVTRPIPIGVRVLQKPDDSFYNRT